MQVNILLAKLIIQLHFRDFAFSVWYFFIIIHGYNSPILNLHASKRNHPTKEALKIKRKKILSFFRGFM